MIDDVSSNFIKRVLKQLLSAIGKLVENVGTSGLLEEPSDGKVTDYIAILLGCMTPYLKQ